MNIIINKSNILAIVFLIFYLLALLSVLISGIHWVLKFMLLLAILISLAAQVRRYLQKTHKESLVQLKLTDNDVVKVRKAGNPEWLATEITSTVIWPWILMLNLRELSPQARNLKLLIARDAVSQEEYRLISECINQISLNQSYNNQAR